MTSLYRVTGPSPPQQTGPFQSFRPGNTLVSLAKPCLCRMLAHQVTPADFQSKTQCGWRGKVAGRQNTGKRFHSLPYINSRRKHDFEKPPDVSPPSLGHFQPLWSCRNVPLGSRQRKEKNGVVSFNVARLPQSRLEGGSITSPMV